MSTLRQLASIATASGAAGFGFAGGRSLWRSLEKGAPAIFFIATLGAGSGLGMYLSLRGSRRLGAWATVIGVALIAISVALSAAILGEAGLVWQGVVFVVGWLVGAPAKRRRRAVAAVESHNERFLQQLGFRDVGGRDETWLDDEDRELVIHDHRTDALIFRIKGQRNGRSRILLDEAGRMIDYQPG